MPPTKIPAELRPDNVRKQLHGFFRLRGTLPAELTTERVKMS